MSTIPATMKAIVLSGHGDIEANEYHEDWPTPQITNPDDVLIKVHACGMNNTDVNTRLGGIQKLSQKQPLAVRMKRSTMKTQAGARLLLFFRVFREPILSARLLQ